MTTLAATGVAFEKFGKKIKPLFESWFLKTISVKIHFRR
jgi:hypothetical protein